MSNMISLKKDRRLNLQSGATNLLMIPLVLVTVLLFGVAAVAFTSYNQAQEYKNDVEQKIQVAVDKNTEEVSATKDKDFAERSKSPFNRYDGPASYGALRILYPKSWSAYVSEPRNRNNKPVDGYFSPGVVPTYNDILNTFALRVVVEQQVYETVLKPYQAKVKDGKITARPYQSPNVPNIVGTRIDGEIIDKKQGAMIIMPMRDKTLRLWTESKDFVPDFENIILPNFSFTP